MTTMIIQQEKRRKEEFPANRSSSSSSSSSLRRRTRNRRMVAAKKYSLLTLIVMVVVTAMMMASNSRDRGRGRGGSDTTGCGVAVCLLVAAFSTTTTTSSYSSSSHQQQHTQPASVLFKKTAPTIRPGAAAASSSISTRNSSTQLLGTTSAAVSSRNASAAAVGTGGALSKFVTSLFNPKKILQASSVLIGMIFKGGDWKDWILILVLAKTPTSLARKLYLQTPSYKRKVRDISLTEPETTEKNDLDGEETEQDEDNEQQQVRRQQQQQPLLDALRKSRLEKYERSKTKRTAIAISEIGQLFGFLKLTEYALVVMRELGWIAAATAGSASGTNNQHLHHLVATVVASVWGANNLSELKSYYLMEYPNIQRQRRGFSSPKSSQQLNSIRTAKTINQVLNVVIWGVTALGILDVVSKMKFGGLATGNTWSTLITRFTTSLFGLSGITTLMISLASRELVSEFLASLAIQGTNMYREGEVVSVGNNDIVGAVQKLGVFHTHIRTSDEKIVRVPNAFIASSKRLANVSRQTFSSVQLTLELSYQDMEKIPNLVKDMKEQIEHGVMILTGDEHTIVRDGTRPYRVHWRDVTYRGIQIVVDIHLRMPPNKDLYFDTRQAILIAISKSCSKHDITYAYEDEQVRRMVSHNTINNGGNDISISNSLATIGVEDDHREEDTQIQ
mmetsp:Transcript_48804/g.118105  ORF Transcript_48804/g.118105 Transcript_48804/m.118105 type:complete len:675 (-) Transcript_48804:228-2252(-)|eukprot:CAMPEP_0113467724 /NCGR_PEP_ID=MMETSP0014_2-20120614/14969_1 /TAXON_ID=2857 /ORGANISM="Nitzschia sp." /LENGTH=674 /DNA_ID=CAMNT_0000360055 /DNA_START=222 /DNA_END=2246 /DNA_ORIENTATION=+ /assembly_acc=CAM_ASM_000159